MNFIYYLWNVISVPVSANPPKWREVTSFGIFILEIYQPTFRLDVCYYLLKLSSFIRDLSVHDAIMLPLKKYYKIMTRIKRCSIEIESLPSLKLKSSN